METNAFASQTSTGSSATFEEALKAAVHAFPQVLIDDEYTCQVTSTEVHWGGFAGHPLRVNVTIERIAKHYMTQELESTAEPHELPVSEASAKAIAGGGSGNPRGLFTAERLDTGVRNAPAFIRSTDGGGSGSPRGLSAEERPGTDTGTTPASISSDTGGGNPHGLLIVNSSGNGVPSGLKAFYQANKIPDPTSWHAWINAMPPQPDDFHVIGEITLDHAGYDVELLKAYPQGINETILLLNLIISEKSGEWQQEPILKQVRYDSVIMPTTVSYGQVSIRLQGQEIANVAVESILYFQLLAENHKQA